jgi:hypothetical protein
MVVLRASRMRVFGLILFVTLVGVGCNADPRCRRETALLRAEILDLEDKLALATAGISYDGEIISSSDEIIVSDPIIDSSGSQIIYESGVTYPSNGTINSTQPLEVQHQIFPIEQPGPTLAEPPTELPIDIESVIPDVNVPADNSSKRHPTIRHRHDDSAPEMEITLDDSLLDLETTSSSSITQITINRHASGGQNVDGLRGDEGLNLLVQPRTGDGSVYLEAGELSVDLIDKNASRGKQIVGHWEFMPAETKLFFARDRQEGEGILLHLPWDQNLPTARNLVASVTFVTSDGRSLKTSSRLKIDPPKDDYSPDDPQVAGWTERDTRWEIGTHNQSVSGESSQWTRSRQRRGNGSRQFATGNQDALTFDEQISRPRVKAIPASSTRPATQLPRWRPVR